MSATLYQQIQQFYDASSGLWEEIWGEHMHHGYYGADGKLKKDRRQAQIDLIEELLKWSGVSQKLDKMGQPCFKDPQHPTIPSDEGCPILSGFSPRDAWSRK